MHDAFLTLFLIGAFGLVAQTITGRLHFGHVSHHVTHAPHAHPVIHGTHGVNSHQANLGSNQSHANGSAKNTAGLWLTGLMSPMTIFSVCLGMGAAGLILLGYIHRPWLVTSIALAIGIAFYAFAVDPLSKLVFGFASKPAAALEGSLASEAEVVSSFNDRGDGVVMLNVDGQTTRVLAHLDPSTMAQAGEIHVGDKLVVTAIDDRSNSCTVAKL